MRLATYNVEWFDHLFDDEGALLWGNDWSGRRDINRSEQTAALGQVFQALDADAVLVVEAPDINRRRDGVRALETFAAEFGLRARKGVAGFANDTQQELILLHDPDAMTARHAPGGGPAPLSPAFDGQYRIDLDVDAAPESVTWSKPPLELSVQTAGGQSFCLIGVHAKSKAPIGARSRDAAMRLSIQNRRKQLAQCIWLRKRVEERLAADQEVIVLGDFNDGPGLDEYEELFGRSSVEIVMGEGEGPLLYDPHARRALSTRLAAPPTSSRFFIASENRYLSALLDYIMVSDGLRRFSPRWHIWHPFDDPSCYLEPSLREALLTASDHFPVTLDIDL